jgi:hypothetical protein
MTLIAAFKCINGYAICADTQETVDGYYRVSVEKLKPKKCGNFQIAIAGSGVSRLIDDCARGLEKSIENTSITSLIQLEDLIRRKLESFNNKKFICYLPIEERPIFIIAARSFDPPLVQIWKTEISELTPISDDPTLIGWDEKIYIHIAQRLHSPTMSIEQGMFVGLYLLNIAEETSNSIRRPFTVLLANANNLDLQQTDDVERWRERVESFRKLADKLVFESINPVISKNNLDQSIQKFKDEVLQLHHRFGKKITRAVTLNQEWLSPVKSNEKIP